jgi:hypothetical protein
MAIDPNQATIPGVGHKIATIAGQVGNEGYALHRPIDCAPQ